ncbi:MAG: hypothetical protein KDM63_10075 [Verrucomicrobiae bacterium]|nr:hypothetical protein [Verrucomicrobiae bacterium]
MSPPPPPDPADTPADEPFPIPSSVPWWRNRRRWFYLALAALPVGMWLGWEWWYWADFPMPGATIPVLSSASSPKPRAAPIWSTYRETVVRWRLRLQSWKTERETRRLRLSDSVWRDENCGAIIHFGQDGILVWEFEPGWEEKLQSNPDPFVSGSQAKWLERQRRLNLTAYVLLPPRPEVGWEEPMLKFVDRPEVGQLLFNGKCLYIGVFDPDNWDPHTGDPESFELYLTPYHLADAP